MTLKEHCVESTLAFGKPYEEIHQLMEGWTEADGVLKAETEYVRKGLKT